MHDNVSNVLYTEEVLAERVAQLGAQITRDYADVATSEAGLVFVSLLRGSIMVAADLARCIDLPMEMEYMTVSSYGNGATSSGEVRIVQDLSADIAGRHVLVVEDILDSGLTLDRLLALLRQRGPASLEVVVLLRKQVKRQVEVPCRYVGFECPDEFIVGYGLDFAQRYRNLPYVGVLKPEAYR